MNRINQNSRLPEIGAIILVVLAAGYYFYSSSGSGSSSGASFTVSSPTANVGANVLALLNQIHSLKIDTSIFQSPEYQSLTDFTVTVPTENIGKSNPFLPAGASGNTLIPAATSTPPAPQH